MSERFRHEIMPHAAALGAWCRGELIIDGLTAARFPDEFAQSVGLLLADDLDELSVGRVVDS